MPATEGGGEAPFVLPLVVTKDLGGGNLLLTSSFLKVDATGAGKGNSGQLSARQKGRGGGEGKMGSVARATCLEKRGQTVGQERAYARSTSSVMTKAGGDYDRAGKKAFVDMRKKVLFPQREPGSPANWTEGGGGNRKREDHLTKERRNSEPLINACARKGAFSSKLINNALIIFGIQEKYAEGERLVMSPERRGGRWEASLPSHQKTNQKTAPALQKHKSRRRGRSVGEKERSDKRLSWLEVFSEMDLETCFRHRTQSEVRGTEKKYAARPGKREWRPRA